MTSTPMHHPDDETRPHPEDQGEDASPETDGGEDLVDGETKKLSRDEAEQHDAIVDAQQDDAEQGGGYGH